MTAREPLDVERAHAVALVAEIMLVEAARQSYGPAQSSGCRAGNGAKVVSMSFTGSEFSSETTYDFPFQRYGRDVYCFRRRQRNMVETFRVRRGPELPF